MATRGPFIQHAFKIAKNPVSQLGFGFLNWTVEKAVSTIVDPEGRASKASSLKEVSNPAAALIGIVLDALTDSAADIVADEFDSLKPDLSKIKALYTKKPFAPFAPCASSTVLFDTLVNQTKQETLKKPETMKTLLLHPVKTALLLK